VSNSNLENSSYIAVQKEIKELFNDLQHNTKPWRIGDREARHQKLTGDFKEQWEQLTGFNPEDKDAVSKWEQQLKESLATQDKERTKASAKDKELLQRFTERSERIKEKRRTQQGR